MDDGTAVTGSSHLFDPGKGQDGVYQQLGPIHYGAAEAGGNEGCLTKQVGNARTYRLPDDVNTKLFADVQQYPQDVLDHKVPAVRHVLHGRRVLRLGRRTHADDHRARLRVGRGRPAERTRYPWGNTPVPGGWDKPYPFDPTGKGFGTPQPAGSDMKRANYRYNFWMPANIQCIGDDPAKCDYSVYIAPPGTFPSGNGPFGHSDLAGNVYDVALPMSGPPGSDPTTRTVGLNRTGAFDGARDPEQAPDPGLPHVGLDEQVPRGRRPLRARLRLLRAMHQRPNKPPLRIQPTTLWEYPSQHYGDGHPGRPALRRRDAVVRHLEPGPAVHEARRPRRRSRSAARARRSTSRRTPAASARGFDLSPYRPDIERADARKLPLETGSVDLVFMDPPYGDHIDYSDDPSCIGKLSAYDPKYYQAMHRAIREAARVLKPGGCSASTSATTSRRRSGFAPVGFQLFVSIAESLEIVDIVTVVRHNKSLEIGNYRKAAEEGNFFLRGFNYLFIAQKPDHRPVREARAEARPAKARPPRATSRRSAHERRRSSRAPRARALRSGAPRRALARARPPSRRPSISSPPT